MENTFKNKLYKLLKKDSRLWDEEKKEINETLLKDLIDKLDERLIELLLSDKESREKFFIKIKDVFVLKASDLKFFVDENKVDNSYTQYQNKIGLRVGNKLLIERDEVVLDWPFKDCVLEGGMTKEDEKRNEIFFNEVLAKDEIDRLEEPKALVNWKRYTKKGEKKVKKLKRDKDDTIRENLIIKGNNLLALHSLKEQFAGKVKLIYIDPPYNTGSDSFGYNDSFKHSTWLTFMKNRLTTARDLLRNDGVIFVQCDDNEQGYIKVLLDQIFNNLYQSTLYIQVRYPEKQLATAMRFHKLIETIFIYSKTEKPLFFQDVADYDISKYEWEITELTKPSKTITLGGKKVDVFEKNKYRMVKKEKTSESLLKEIWASGKILDSSSTGRFFRDFLTGRYSEDGYGVLYKVHGIGSGLGYRYITGPQKQGATKGKYYQEIPKNKTEENFIGGEKAISNYYDMAADFGNCRHEGGVELRSGKKPEVLLREIIKMVTNTGDLVMDFHLGTGGTCAVAHKMGRQYIGIEQLDYNKNDSIIRLKNVINGDQTGISKAVGWQGGGDFVYVELAKWNEEAKEKILKAKSLNDLEKLFDELYERYFLNYNVKTKEFKGKTLKEEEFRKLGLDKQKKLFIEMLDMNQMYVNFSERNDKKYNLSKEDIALSEEFYSSKN